MADRTIGELPSSPTIYDDTLFVAEQAGEAIKITGKQFRSMVGTKGGGFIETTSFMPVDTRPSNTLFGQVIDTYD